MDRKQFPFEKLEVWQEARQLVNEVYDATERFPAAEKYGITSQLRRAPLSVANNLAEGSGRASFKDQAHFSAQAYGSLMETVSDLIISIDRSFLPQETAAPILNHAYDLSVRVHNLRESQLRRSS